MLIGTSNNSMKYKTSWLKAGSKLLLSHFEMRLIFLVTDYKKKTSAVFVVRNPYQHRVVFFSAVYEYCLEKTHLSPTFHPLLRQGKEVVFFSVTLNNKLIKTYFNKFNNLKM